MRPLKEYLIKLSASLVESNGINNQSSSMKQMKSPLNNTKRLGELRNASKKSLYNSRIKEDQWSPKDE